jgi:hypothetical protein
MGTYAAIAITTAVALAYTSKSRRARMMCAAAAVLIGAALASSQSRSAVIAVFAGLACLGLIRSRRLAIILITVGFAATVFI